MTKTIQERIREHNAKLDQMMVAQGYVFKQGGHYEGYVDSNRNFVPFPNGYVRGPFYRDNGNPRPRSYSMQSENGWLQMGFLSKREADDWIAERLDQWDAAHAEKVEPPVETLDVAARPSTAEILIAVVILAMAILGMWLRGW